MVATGAAAVGLASAGFWVGSAGLGAGDLDEAGRFIFLTGAVGVEGLVLPGRADWLAMETGLADGAAGAWGGNACGSDGMTGAQSWVESDFAALTLGFLDFAALALAARPGTGFNAAGISITGLRKDAGTAEAASGFVLAGSFCAPDFLRAAGLAPTGFTGGGAVI